jgi:ferredoxin
MYIHPDECIDCGLCLSVCPVDAIYTEDDLPSHERRFIAVNAEFFDPAVTGRTSRAGADPGDMVDLDHPLVAAAPRGGAAADHD